MFHLHILGELSGYKKQLDSDKFLSSDMAIIESAFQGKTLHEYWIENFGATGYEGAALCYKHTNTFGEAIWITSDGIRIIRRDKENDNGMWYGWYVYKF